MDTEGKVHKLPLLVTEVHLSRLLVAVILVVVVEYFCLLLFFITIYIIIKLIKKLETSALR
jgi:hypothetical protein